MMVITDGLRIGETYYFRFSINGSCLNYTGVLLDFDEGFLKFKDKYGRILTYNLSCMLFFEEVKKDG